MALWKTIALWAVIMLSLGLAFLMYVRPDFMVDVNNLVWSCFGPAPGR